MPERAHNLPAELSSFVGRDAEVARLAALLTPESRPADQAASVGPRLVTLAGPGGIGKTRLAQRVAHALRAVFVDGVWLVELAALADPALVPQAMLAAFGGAEAVDGPPRGALTARAQIAAWAAHQGLAPSQLG